VRDVEEQEFALSLCRGCEKACGCGGSRIPQAVRVVMGSEGCPGLRW
jgi:hypothetical protein